MSLKVILKFVNTTNTSQYLFYSCPDFQAERRQGVESCARLTRVTPPSAMCKVNVIHAGFLQFERRLRIGGRDLCKKSAPFFSRALPAFRKRKNERSVLRSCSYSLTFSSLRLSSVASLRLGCRVANVCCLCLCCAAESNLLPCPPAKALLPCLLPLMSPSDGSQSFQGAVGYAGVITPRNRIRNIGPSFTRPTF